MDLIQMYQDQGSQSSSSCEEPIIIEQEENVVRNTPPRPKIPQRSFQPPQPHHSLSPPPLPPPPPPQQQQQHNGTNGRQLPRYVDKLQRNQPTNFAQWMTDIDKRVHLCLGSLNVLHKNTILESMDYFINKLTKDYNKLIKPKIADHLSNYIRTYLYVYRYLYRSFEMGKRYFKRIIKILAIYTDMELCASIRGTEYDTAIAERIQFIYQTHLLVSDQNMVLDVLLNMKRLWRRHRGILNLLLQHFLFLSEPVEFADLLFIKNLIVYKRWLYIEEVTEDRNKIREAFVKFVKPKKTICMNSLFKPYLPVDEEGFVRIENLSGVLDSEISIAQLTRAMRKAEESNESQAKEILIVLTDDEDDVPTNEFTQLNSNSHHSHIDDLSNDFDGQSSISTHSTHTSNDIMMIDTLSIDTLPSQESAVTRHSIDLVTDNDDNTTSLSECVNTVEDSSESDSASARELRVPCDIMSLNSSNSNEYANTNDVPMVDTAEAASEANDSIAILCRDLNTRQNIVNEIPPLDQSTFNNLVSNINETQISDSFANAASNNSTVDESILIVGKPPPPVVTRHEMSCQTTISLPIHSDISEEHLTEIPRTSTQVVALLTTDGDFVEPMGAIDGLDVADQVLVETWTSENCDTVNTSISNASLGNHQETLLNIDEIVSADLNSIAIPVEKTQAAHEPIASETIPQHNVSTQISGSVTEPVAEETEETLLAIPEIRVTPTKPASPSKESTPTKSVTSANKATPTKSATHAKSTTPAAPAANDSVTETVLLSQSEQELLFTEEEEAIAMDIFSSGNDSMRAGTSRRSIPSPTMSIDDRPPIWMRNGINNPPKTYSKIRKEKSDANKQMPNNATQQMTSRANTSARPVEDEDSFLMDIFCSNEVRSRLKDTTPSRAETVYSSSTPNLPMTPPVGQPVPKVNRRATRVSRKVNETPKVIKSPTKVPSPRKNTKRSESMTTKGNAKRQPKSPKSPKKSTPTRTKTLNKSRLDRLLAAAPPTILTRQTYVKPLNHQTSADFDINFETDICTEKLHHSSTFFTSSFGRRSNGKFGLTPAKNTSSTILERKTYIKASASNTTPSHTSSSLQSQPFDSCSHNTSGSSTTNTNYPSNAAMDSGGASYGGKNNKSRYGSVVSNDSAELDYLFSGDLDSSKGIRNPLPGLNSTRNTDHQSAATVATQKRHQLSSEYSDLDEMDDSTGYNTRKSKRSRKRPKKLDL